MKKSTYEKINRAAKWTERYEPNWYLGWGIGTTITLLFWGTFWGWPFMYFVLAGMSHDRNTAKRYAEQWEANSSAWENLYQSASDRADYWESRNGR